MNFLDWLKPGIRIKRWIFLSLIGILSISFGFSFIFRIIYKSVYQYILAGSLMVSGCIFITLSVKYLMETIYKVLANSGFKVSLDSDKLSWLLYEKRILIRGPKIVVIGGGTGISTILRGLKVYSSNITAVVTVADDGGGSGVLRSDLGMLPPGDIRNCILSLADTEPLMEKLLQYRFTEGILKGQSFGNLFLAAMDGISDNFEEAVKKMSDVLAVTGRVLPVTLEQVKLIAELDDGFIIQGESNIGRHNDTHRGKINKILLDPKDAMPLKEVIEAIKEADLVLLGPGSLYTSVIPNLLVTGIVETLKESKAIKCYIGNVMTQPGETEGYSLSQHIKAIEEHSVKGIVQYCIANVQAIPLELKEKYMEDGSYQVEIDEDLIREMGIEIVKGEFVTIKNEYIRHNAKQLAESIVKLVAEKILAKDRKRSLDYFFIKDQLRKVKNAGANNID